MTAVALASISLCFVGSLHIRPHVRALRPVRRQGLRAGPIVFVWTRESFVWMACSALVGKFRPLHKPVRIKGTLHVSIVLQARGVPHASGISLAVKKLVRLVHLSGGLDFVKSVVQS